MQELKCKKCGGPLILIEGENIAECEYCGTRQAVKMIPGTGSVDAEAAGHTPAGQSMEKLQKKLAISLEDGQWAKARELADEMLDADPEAAEGYLGMYMAVNFLSTRESMEEAFLSGKVQADVRFERFRKYAKGEDADWISGLVEKKRAADEEREQAQNQAEAAAEEERRAKEEEFRREKERLDALREKRKGTEGMLAFLYGRICAVDNRGKVLVSRETEKEPLPQNAKEAEDWENIIALAENSCADDAVLAALRNDGTVVFAERKDGISNLRWTKVSEWKGIKVLRASGYAAFGNDEYRLYGLTEEGTWLSANRSPSAGFRPDPPEAETFFLSERFEDTGEIIIQEDGKRYMKTDSGFVRTNGSFPDQDWQGIVSVSVRYALLAAVKEDGTVLVDCCGYKPSDTDRKTAEYVHEGLKRHRADWSNIIAVKIGNNAIYGVTARGRLVCQAFRKSEGLTEEEENSRLLGTAKNWKLFDHPDGIIRERNLGIIQSGLEKIEERRKQQLKEAETKVRSLQKERHALWGPFSRKKREEVEESLRYWESVVKTLRETDIG